MDELTRTYRHPACGGETAVSGEALRELASPVVTPVFVRCANCGKVGRAGEFIWTHTEENIDQALARIRRGLSWPLRLGTGVTFLIVLNCLSVGTGVAVGIWDQWWTGILVGFVSAAALFQLNLATMDRLTRRHRIPFEQLL